MSSDPTECQHCDPPKATANGFVLCKNCRKTCRKALENVAIYHADLLSIGGQQGQVRRRAGGVSDPTGSAAAHLEPTGDPADQAAADTKSQLVEWTHDLHQAHPELRDGQPDTRSRTVLDLTRYLARHLDAIARLDWAPEFATDLVALERRLRKIIERGKGRWYAGICEHVIEPERPHDAQSCTCACHTLGPPLDAYDIESDCDVPGGCNPDDLVIAAVLCDRVLYAVPGQTTVRCPLCRTSHSVAARRSTVLEQAHEELLPLNVIAQACVTLLEGEPSVERLYKRIHNWIRRDQIKDYGVRVLTGRPQRVYRLGDVIDTLIADASPKKVKDAC